MQPKAPLLSLGNRHQQGVATVMGVIGVLCAGTWMMPLTTGTAHDIRR
jgi:hypothetical protein